MSNGQRNPQMGKRNPSEAPRTKTVKVPAKIHTGELSELDFVPGSGPLKDSFTVIVSSAGTHRQFTIHHPIGITDLKGDDWVITRSDEVQSLLARQVDPDKQRIDQARADMRLKLAAARKLLKFDETTKQYQYPDGTDRAKIVEIARQKANEETKRVRALETAQHVGTGPVVHKPLSIGVLDFLDEKTKKFEEAIREFVGAPDIVKQVEEKYPYTFRTRSGPTASAPQVSASKDGTPLSPGQAYDEIVKRIVQVSLAVAPERKPAPPVTPPPKD